MGERAAAPPVHRAERERLSTLQTLGLLDSAPEEGFDAVTRLACRFIDVPIALVSLIDGDRQWFKSRQGLDASETPRQHAFCAHAIADDAEIFVVEDATTDVRFAENPLVVGAPDIRFYAGIPIRTPNGLPMGTLCVIDSQPRELDAGHAATMVDLAQVVERELHALYHASIDPLTGLRNRRALQSAGDVMFPLADRAGTPTCAIYVDLDGLKRINDTFGHEAGDAAITEVAVLLRQAFRRSDIVARVGGDEFVVLMPLTDRDQAAIPMGRLADAIAEANADATRPYGVSCSIGLAERLPGGGDLAALLATADVDLYERRALVRQ